MTRKDARTEILDAAAQCFARHGSEQSSIDAIARAMGATKGKVYHHFRSKGELVSEVRLRSVQLTQDAVEPAFGRDAPAGDRFHAMACAHVRAMIDALDYHRVVVEHLRSDAAGSTTSFEREKLAKIRAAQSHYENMYRTVIETGIATGTFRDQPISVALHSVLMLLNAPVYWYRRRDGETDAERTAICKQLADMALGALRRC